MSEKCEHESAIVLFEESGLSVKRCTWVCADLLVSHLLPNGITVTQTVGEIATLQDELNFFRTQFPTAAKNYRNAMEKMKEIENG